VHTTIDLNSAQEYTDWYKEDFVAYPSPSEASSRSEDPDASGEFNPVPIMELDRSFVLCGPDESGRKIGIESHEKGESWAKLQSIRKKKTGLLKSTFGRRLGVRRRANAGYGKRATFRKLAGC